MRYRMPGDPPRYYVTHYKTTDVYHIRDREDNDRAVKSFHTKYAAEAEVNLMNWCLGGTFGLRPKTIRQLEKTLSDTITVSIVGMLLTCVNSVALIIIGFKLAALLH